MRLTGLARTIASYFLERMKIDISSEIRKVLSSVRSVGLSLFVFFYSLSALLEM